MVFQQPALAAKARGTSPGAQAEQAVCRPEGTVTCVSSTGSSVGTEHCDRMDGKIRANETGVRFLRLDEEDCARTDARFVRAPCHRLSRRDRSDVARIGHRQKPKLLAVTRGCPTKLQSYRYTGHGFRGGTGLTARLAVLIGKVASGCKKTRPEEIQCAGRPRGSPRRFRYPDTRHRLRPSALLQSPIDFLDSSSSLRACLRVRDLLRSE